MIFRTVVASAPVDVVASRHAVTVLARAVLDDVAMGVSRLVVLVVGSGARATRFRRAGSG
jgi:hypothetical protein